VSRRVAARDLFHLIFDCEFALLEGDFFELFGVGEVVALGELVEAVVQFVVSFDELAVLIVFSQ
jgi:hypothetical protein